MEKHTQEQVRPTSVEKFAPKNKFLKNLLTLSMVGIVSIPVGLFVYDTEVTIPNNQELKESKIVFEDAGTINPNLAKYKIKVEQNEVTRQNPEEVKRVLKALEVVISDTNFVVNIVKKPGFKIFFEDLIDNRFAYVNSNNAIYFNIDTLKTLTSEALEFTITHELSHTFNNLEYNGLGKYRVLFNNFTKIGASDKCPDIDECNADKKANNRQIQLGRIQSKKYYGYPLSFYKN